MEAFTYLKLQPSQLSHRHYRQSISQFFSINPNKSSTLSQLKHSLNKNPLTLFKTPLIITIASTTLFYCGLCIHPPLPAIAKQQEQSPMVETLSSDRNVEALRSLMNANIKSKKPLEAIKVINKLIELEPNEFEWPLLRSQLYFNMGEAKLAKAGFEAIIAKDPANVEALIGLVMAVSTMELNAKELDEVAIRIHEALQWSKEDKLEEQMMDVKLLAAQILAMNGEYMEALKIFEELMMKKPRDFRPYLYQGIIYSMLKNKDEAQKQFDKFKSLLPKRHLYSVMFHDKNPSEVFSQLIEDIRG